ncbi:hypothetical protein P170DRAFT_513717 [Aspergillus steynii IBT 23096]|uniref:Uncharacterized protein n=1 Tax=Aspergillus steynii IBT 23096 TaxID=1392250 RepID=A0A2I2FVA3_9EURO|nr:uncharacterized protein P170DRAFT_513717 [Aspergillus steynii IBT 23096]PLB44552.1 hypothetical protein P170DRAFT_513717 [Aspergillus steynii IBT 23096]
MSAPSGLPSNTERPPEPPDWLVTWRKRYQGQPWGFVGFRTTPAVEEFPTRARETAEIPLDEALEQGLPADEIAEARRTFEIRWFDVEEQEEEEGKEKLDPVERMRARYRTMRESGTLPPGLASPVFLCASPLAVASVPAMSSGEMPGTTSSRWRPWAPFLLAVATELEQGLVDEEVDESIGCRREKDWFKPVFRVAVEVLVEELWWVVVEQINTLGRMTRFVQEASVTEERQGDDDDDDDDDDDLDAIWWTVHAPPRHMRKRRMFASE